MQGTGSIHYFIHFVLFTLAFGSSHALISVYVSYTVHTLGNFEIKE